MKCQTCGQELDPQTKVCPNCQTEQPPIDAISGQVERVPKRGDPDIDVWQAPYSMRGMIGTWVTLAVITVAVIVLDAILVNKVAKDQALLVWGITLGIMVVVWVFFLLVGLYRHATIQYRLTTYRFYNQKGLLFRSLNSMEVIDIEDLALHQNLLERLAGVGRIILRTKDPSDPILELKGVANPHEAFKRIDKARRDEHVRRSIKVE